MISLINILFWFWWNDTVININININQNSQNQSIKYNCIWKFEKVFELLHEITILILIVEMVAQTSASLASFSTLKLSTRLSWKELFDPSVWSSGFCITYRVSSVVTWFIYPFHDSSNLELMFWLLVLIILSNALLGYE